jgi:hypothetical protein
MVGKMIPAIKWAAKDKNDKIWLFENKPCKDKEHGCWYINKGEEWFDIDRLLLPLRTYKLIVNCMKRTPDWEQSLTKLDPNTWMTKA